jgi:hypothetical protein
VAKEHPEEKLKIEIMFLRAQVLSKSEEKRSIEENLTQEINALQKKTGNVLRLRRVTLMQV